MYFPLEAQALTLLFILGGGYFSLGIPKIRYFFPKIYAIILMPTGYSFLCRIMLLLFLIYVLCLLQ